jgi:hypothetical protein
MPALAFLPWIAVNEPIEVGQIRLLPYERGQLPGNMPGVTQDEIDRVLTAYAHLPNRPIERATLFEWGNWHSGEDAEPFVPQMFGAQKLLAFSALSQRRLFRGHFDYCNSHHYQLVIQRFTTQSAGTFSFTARRRDGHHNYLWSSDHFAFHRPNHVPSGDVSLDTGLLLAMQAIPQEQQRAYHEAINEFVSANTDSPDMPEHAEVVMTKSAYEWLLCIDENARSFTRALGSLFDGIALRPASGALAVQWRSARNTQLLLEAWGREFCALRGVSAHGRDRQVSTFVWQSSAHLAFAALLFPVVVRRCLARDGLLERRPFDDEFMRRVEDFISVDPVSHAALDADVHPWARLHLDVTLRSSVMESLRAAGLASPFQDDS